jgi:hypothetical protein
VSSIWNFATNDHTNRLIDIENTTMGAVDQQFGEDLFLSSKDDSIFAFDSNNGSE